MVTLEAPKNQKKEVQQTDHQTMHKVIQIKPLAFASGKRKKSKTVKGRKEEEKQSPACIVANDKKGLVFRSRYAGLLIRPRQLASTRY